MQKTRKLNDSPAAVSNHSFSRPSHRYSVSLPEAVSVDVLGAMLDEDMLTRLRVLEEDRNKVIETRGDPRPWEEEIAYVKREQQMRRVRRDNHTEFTRKEQQQFDSVESVLPPGDFDNSAFVYAATGGRPRWN